MARTCVFCGASPTTREHVWPQWLSLFPKPAALLKLKLIPEPVRRTRTDLNSEGRFETSESILGGRKPLPSDLTVKVVCGPCNNGWMSDLEKRVQPVVRRLAARSGHRLQTDDLEALATWIFKTALMYAFWDPEATPFTPAVYRHFYRARTIPESAIVWMTRSESRWAEMAMFMRNMKAESLSRPDRSPNELANNSTAMYLGVEGVAFLLHYSRLLGPEYLVLMPPHDRGWIRLYPSAESVQWPQRPMKERSLLDAIHFMGSDLDPTPSFSIEGRTPDELRRAQKSHFAGRLMEGAYTGEISGIRLR